MKILSPEAALMALQESSKCLLIDIREPYELLNCKIDCLSIPMASFAAKYPSLQSYEQIILMCQSGKRAEALANYIDTEFNAMNIYVLDGGINAWIAQNAPQITCQ
ncbi:MAG: rhodanese-like domain-containing protein [Sphingomonadales bacterium]